MAYTFGELKTKTVAELREIASGIQDEAVKGYTQLNKEHLLVALCNALHVDTREHRVAKVMDKAAIKSAIRQLKAEREVSLHDGKKMKTIHHDIHELKRKLRRAAENPS